MTDIPKIGNARDKPERTLKIIDSGDPRYCPHRQAQVDKHSREVTCRRCEAILDPFEWLLNIANSENRAFADYATIKKQTQSLRESIVKLKAEEKRIKARLRNARKSLAKAEQ